MLKKLQEPAKLVQVLKEVKKLLEIFEHKDEYFFVKESLNSKAIPAPNC
jgi:hypothetical protein